MGCGRGERWVGGRECGGGEGGRDGVDVCLCGGSESFGGYKVSVV